MGKRKERRLAAMIAAGRRVKLDLFAEPSSGEMVDTSLHEVGGDPDQDHRAGVPLSPSSGKTQNPLSLLGQYSDDELDEEDNKRPKHAAERSSSPRSSSPDIDAQVEKPVDAGAEAGVNTEEDMAGHNDQQEPDQLENVKEPDGNDVTESDVVAEVAVAGEVDLPPKICISESSVMEADGDMTGGWKMVLHEQSNRYYYWNTVTGETSWDIPSDLTVETQVAGGQNISSECNERAGPLVDIHTSTHVNNEPVAYAYVTAVDGIGIGNPISEHAADYGTVLGIGKENNEAAHLAYDAHQILTHYSTGVAGISYQGSSMLPEYGSSHQSQNVLPEQLTEHHVVHGDMDKRLIEFSERDERTDVHSAQLLKYGESLLQRLKSLDRSGHNFDGHQSIVKEIEVRLSDCKALSSYGSLLLPFWWHTETQLKQFESAISHEEASLAVQTESYGQIEEKPNQSSVRVEPPVQGTGAGPELVEDKARLSSVENNNSSTTNDISKGQIEDSSQIPDGEDGNTNRLSCGSSDQQLDSMEGQEVVLETHPIVTPVHMVTITESHAEENMDVDMDVEMEVDEETPGDQTSAQDLSSSERAPSEQFIQPNLSSSACPTAPSDESVAPLPPDEEWIPPPPPDSELIPPPPPEELPVPIPPPPYADTVSYHSYQGQYDIGYTVQNYEYYAPTASGITNGNYYAHNEGAYSTEPQQPPCYVPVVASSFPEVPTLPTPVEPVPYYDVSSATIRPVPVATNAAEPVPYYVVSSVTIPPVPVDSNAVEPVPYYDVSSAIIPPVPLATTAGSSEFYVECGPVSYISNVAASDQTTSVGFGMEHGSSSLPEVNLEPDISQPPSIASTAQTAGATLANGSIADVQPLVAPKSQSKAMRSKKRTAVVVPGLRSNKKVSSLVDKWKAAKEELHGEEDEEPASAYEMLEKKRQRDIEQWRTRQIATGEAKDNANFLPLGVDWRERVKRKKAKAGAVQTSSDTVGDEKKELDLAELSKDLPSGWQAYWDESTKVVYYGNTVTSETTWTRPT